MRSAERKAETGFQIAISLSNSYLLSLIFNLRNTTSNYVVMHLEPSIFLCLPPLPGVAFPTEHKFAFWVMFPPQASLFRLCWVMIRRTLNRRSSGPNSGSCTTCAPSVTTATASSPSIASWCAGRHYSFLASFTFPLSTPAASRGPASGFSLLPWSPLGEPSLLIQQPFWPLCQNPLSYGIVKKHFGQNGGTKR